jgi:hypothetical protein
MMLRAFTVWLVIGLAEVLQGILRVRLLNRRVGDHRARQIGVFVASGVILVIAGLAMPWIGASKVADLLGIGLFWVVLMLALDIGFGRLVFHASWDRIFAEFDLRRGGLLGFGVAVIFFAPLLMAKLRGLL